MLLHTSWAAPAGGHLQEHSAIQCGRQGARCHGRLQARLHTRLRDPCASRQSPELTSRTSRLLP